MTEIIWWRLSLALYELSADFAEMDRNTADFFLGPSVPVILIKLDRGAILSQSSRKKSFGSDIFHQHVGKVGAMAPIGLLQQELCFWG